MILSVYDIMQVRFYMSHKPLVFKIWLKTKNVDIFDLVANNYLLH